MAALQAFREFDFDADPAWQAVEARLEIPPGKEAVLLYRRAKWYKEHIDSNLDPELVKPPRAEPVSVPTPSPAPASSPNQAAETDNRSQRSSFASLDAPALAASNVVVLLTGLAASPYVALGFPTAFYNWFLLSCAIANIYKLYFAVGLPTRVLPWGPSSFASLKAWGARFMTHPAFLGFSLDFLLLNNSPFLTVIVSSVIPAVYIVGDYLAASRLVDTQIWRTHGARGYQWLKSKTGDACLLVAGCEVATGVLLLLGLFSRRRNFMLTLMYWRSVLPARYWSAEAGPYHRMVWSRIGDQTRSIRLHYPALQKVVDFAARFFQRPA